MIAHQLIGEGLVCMRMIHHCGGLAQLEERVFVHPDSEGSHSGHCNCLESSGLEI